jgi:hypothetical protein
MKLDPSQNQSGFRSENQKINDRNWRPAAAAAVGEAARRRGGVGFWRGCGGQSTLTAVHRGSLGRVEAPHIGAGGQRLPRGGGFWRRWFYLKKSGTTKMLHNLGTDSKRRPSKRRGGGTLSCRTTCDGSIRRSPELSLDRSTRRGGQRVLPDAAPQGLALLLLLLLELLELLSTQPISVAHQYKDRGRPPGSSTSFGNGGMKTDDTIWGKLCRVYQCWVSEVLHAHT